MILLVVNGDLGWRLLVGYQVLGKRESEVLQTVIQTVNQTFHL